MKDIMNIYKKYGTKMGLIAITFFILIPINMMIDFAWNGYIYNILLINVVDDICSVYLLIMLANDLKSNNEEYIYKKMPIYTAIAILNALIFVSNLLTTIL